jgi:hypothetical protein
MKFINGWTKNKVIKHIEKNFKGKAQTEDGFCIYKTEDGKKCAVGMFIPDGHSAANSITNVEGLLLDYPDLKKVMPFSERDLRIFQNVHDQCDNLDYDPRTDEEVLMDLISFIECET